MLGLLLSALVLGLWAATRTHSVPAALWILHLILQACLIYAVARSCGDKLQKLVMAGTAWSSLGVSLLVLWQVCFGYTAAFEVALRLGIQDPGVLRFLGAHRAFGPFVSPNLAAGFLLLGCGVCFAHFRHWSARGLPLLALLLTQSLGAWLCLGTAFLVLYRHQKMTSSRNLYRWALFLGTFSVLFLFLLRHGSWSDFAGAEHSFQGRIAVWGICLQMILSQPWTGWGLGNLGAAYSLFYQPNALPSSLAHSWPLQWGVEMGMGGLFLGTSILGMIFWRTRNLWKEPELKWLALGIWACSLHFLGDVGAAFPELWLPYWAIVGCAVPAPPAFGAVSPVQSHGTRKQHFGSQGTE